MFRDHFFNLFDKIEQNLKDCPRILMDNSPDGQRILVGIKSVCAQALQFVFHITKLDLRTFPDYDCLALDLFHGLGLSLSAIRMRLE